MNVLYCIVIIIIHIYIYTRIVLYLCLHYYILFWVYNSTLFYCSIDHYSDTFSWSLLSIILFFVPTIDSHWGGLPHATCPRWGAEPYETFWNIGWTQHKKEMGVWKIRFWSRTVVMGKLCFEEWYFGLITQLIVRQTDVSSFWHFDAFWL